MNLRPSLAPANGLTAFCLIHSPILALGNLLLLNVQMPTLSRFRLMVAVALPVAVALSYVFNLLGERHSMTSQQKTAKRGATTIPGARHAAESMGK